MKPIAVILSGCGKQDGSEIHEAVATLLAIDRAGATAQCFAPDIMQAHVVNHLTNETMKETRHALVEAARIARGEIRPLSAVNIDSLDGAIYPGGYGAALTLCDFAKKGADCTLSPEVLSFAKAMAQAHKPQGFICIAPVMISAIYGPGVEMTIGQEKETAALLEKMGNIHHVAKAHEVVVDAKHKVVSTPAYMEAQRIHEVFDGIDALVKAMLRLI